MQPRPVARPPAVLVLKPLKPVAPAAKGTTLPNSASDGLRPLLPRISRSSSAPLPTVRGMGRCSCPAPRTKSRDEAEREPHRAPAKQGAESASAAERRPAPRERGMAYQIFAGLYVCALVFFWRTGELIVVNAEEALERLRRYVRDNFFNQKR